jgi:hypothetical protein
VINHLAHRPAHRPQKHRGVAGPPNKLMPDTAIKKRDSHTVLLTRVRRDVDNPRHFLEKSGFERSIRFILAYHEY